MKLTNLQENYKFLLNSQSNTPLNIRVLHNYFSILKKYYSLFLTKKNKINDCVKMLISIEFYDIY